MSDNTDSSNIKTDTKDSAPVDKKPDDISPETKKVIEKSQLIQAEIQSAQLQSIKDVYDLVKNIDEETKKKIEKQFGEGVIQIDEIDEDGNIKPFTKPYTALTTRGEEAVNKYIREVKAFRADVKAKLPLEDLQKRYPELTMDINSLEEIAPEVIRTPQRDEKGNILRDKKGNILEDVKTNDSESFIQLIDNYLMKKKAKIYFKIDDISNFPKKDLHSLIYLYQYRNNYNPYYVSQT